MNHVFALCLFVSSFASIPSPPVKKPNTGDEKDYTVYHRTIAQAHKKIADKQYQEALVLYRQIVDRYAFVFLNEYKVAAQLAIQTGEKQEAFTYLKRAIATGWRMDDMKKNALVRTLQGDPGWKAVEHQYDSLSAFYPRSGNEEIRDRVRRMFNKDQRKALLALFHFSSKGQERYAEKKFAPHSEKQLAQLSRIINTYGYPGEKLIRNGYWASVILSHHNSISTDYNLKDTLYVALRPKLLKAIELGDMSPYEFVRIDDWSVTSRSGRKEKQFGHLSSSLTSAELKKANQLREEIGMSSVETMNSLIDLQAQTGMNFYLPSDFKQKINSVE